MIGIEIEPSAIKSALVRKKGGYELLNWEIFELPEGVVKSTGIADIDTLLKNLIKIPAKFELKNPQVAFSISGPTNSAIRILELPYIDENEIELNLPMELDKYIPFSVKEVFYDYQIIEKSKNKNTSKVIVAVALKELVNDYANILEKAGMIPLVADISCLALYNVYEVNYQEPSVSAIVNIAENVINFNIVKGRQPLYIRDSINAYNIPIENANEDEIRNYADEVSAEIYRQVEYFKTINPENPVEKVYITGIPTVSPLFLQSLQERLDIDISLFNPFKNIKIHKDISSKMQKYSAISSISIGLSLRGTEKIK
ncbi:pilus assembly protein PilM [Thermodesulfovibrio sp. 1176]|uniref:type IV pilus biogenesis protein PilM n=1 Tax=Thermodesulfovibrio sp. 1176 TaxID=3043424 RepID=UPI00248213E7|nr:pilus assembly protein PilM [Thermodesulfovibrio sp. 1176]